MIVQFRNEKVSNHGSIPITIDCNVVAFIVFEEGFHQPIKRTKHQAQDALDRPVIEEDCHIVRNARVQPTASSAAILARVVPSLGIPCVFLNHTRCLAEGRLGSCGALLRVLPLTPNLQRLRLEWCRARETGLQRNGTESRFNLGNDDNRVCVWIPVVSALNPAFDLQRHTAPHSWCDDMECHCLQ
ncbi:transposable element Tcb2 transposase [Trichonephila clavipes]|nr:transposable element Tcb2 transposase [Trichonephila clavipes]